jgi:5'-3' exonuclease
MGIPLYFKTILDNFPEVIKDVKEISKTNRLFLDLNCAIHPCCRRILKEHYNPNKKQQNENKMITEIKDYIKLIVELVSPKLLFIAIDGVAPCAKMAQQRLRRYKKFKDLFYKNEIKQKLNMPEDPEEWDTNAITPGTHFMTVLNNELLKEIKNNSLYHNIDVIFSNSNVPGEGEHKIFEYIRENNSNLYTDLIYGLDADLIMLSLSAMKSNLYLLRESLEFGKLYYESGYQFLLLDIDLFKQSILQEIRSELFANTNYNNENPNELSFIPDYVFSCFILGNDFLPHMPSVDLRHNGIDIILKVYSRVYADLNQNLINLSTLKINTKFLYCIFNELQKTELDTLQHISKKRNRFRLRKPYENNYDKLTDLLHNSPILNLETENKINFNSSGWEQRYYQICFGISTQKEINEVCHNYIEGLSWILEYYFKKCKSWEWTYKYRHAPLLKDLANYVKSYDNINKIVKIPSGNPNKPFQQLLSVLPYQSRGLLPPSYQALMTSLNSNIKQYYPIDYHIDTVFKRYFWQCQPILPVIVNKKIRTASNSCKLSIDEKKRNSFEENIFIERKIKNI